MAEPMVRQLREAWPAARIVIVALIAPMAAVFEGIERVETLVTGRGLKNLFAGARATRRLRPDIYLVPFPSNRWQYNALAAFSGAKRVVIHRYPMNQMRALAFLHRDRIPAERGIHDVIQNLRLLTKLGIGFGDDDLAPRFAPIDANRSAADAELAAVGLKEKSFAVLHAGSAKTILAQAKRWPSENYAKLACAIPVCHDLEVLIVEGPDEKGVSEEIRSMCYPGERIHALKLIGPLGQSAAVLSRAKFYVGTDSGLAHLSAAVGVPPVTLFAPADPDRVCPYGYRDLVVQPPDGKRPSFLYPWQSTKPKLPADQIDRIKSITVEQVMAIVQKVMHGTGS